MDEARFAPYPAKSRWQMAASSSDDDYLRLHQRGIPHAGIAYCRQQTRSIGEMLRALILMGEVLTLEEIENQVELL